jgi:hypothetical protein
MKKTELIIDKCMFEHDVAAYYFKKIYPDINLNWRDLNYKFHLENLNYLSDPTTNENEIMVNYITAANLDEHKMIPLGIGTIHQYNSLDNLLRNLIDQVKYEIFQDKEMSDDEVKIRMTLEGFYSDN